MTHVYRSTCVSFVFAAVGNDIKRKITRFPSEDEANGKLMSLAEENLRLTFTDANFVFFDVVIVLVDLCLCGTNFYPLIS